MGDKCDTPTHVTHEGGDFFMKEVKRTRARSFTAETPEEFDEKYNMISDELTEAGITPTQPQKDGEMYHIFYSRNQ